MLIKNILIENPVVLAPMAGITDRTFRDVVKDFGCGLVYTEMISAKALTYKNTRTQSLVDIEGERKPVTVQLFGSEPAVMAEAALMVEELGADIIDINMGCPVPKVVKNCEGSALMRHKQLATDIIGAVVKKVKIPVTVKIRKGWDDSNVNAVEFAQMAEGEGVSSIAVHGRTREQYYAGTADWDIIKQVQKAVRVPIIGSGDIWQPEDAEKMMEKTGCKGVMIGRGALGNPWLIKRTVHFLETGILLPPPTPREKIEMAIYQLEQIINCKGEKTGVKEMRKHVTWYLKGLKNAARLRDLINRLNTKSEVTESLLVYLKELEEKAL